MFRKLLVLVAAVFVVATTGGIAPAANAQTNYPVEPTCELRADGHVVNATVGVEPGEQVTAPCTRWAPNSVVQITFFSTPIDLGRHQTDSQGILHFSFTAPNVEPGVHTVRFEGTGANGQPRVVNLPLRILGSEATGAPAGDASRFAKTGPSHLKEMLEIGFALLAAGIALVIAVRRSRQNSLTA